MLGRLVLAHADLLAADLDIARVVIKRRVRLAAVCRTISAHATLAGPAWLIAGSWNTSYRYTVLGGLTIGFAAIAIVGWLNGRRRDEPQVGLFAHVAAWDRISAAELHSAERRRIGSVQDVADKARMQIAYGQGCRPAYMVTT